MTKAKKLGDFSGNDVELCRTTNQRVGDETTELLVKESIPFTKNCIRVPFFKREKYHGASKVYVIRINPHRYGQARRALDRLDLVYRQRLVLSNY